MFIDVPRIIDLVFTEGESRRQELKSSISWKDSVQRFKITKTILAMPNIPDGGRIIIGVEDNKGIYEPKGMIESDFQSFNQDDVCDHMGKYADPFVTLLLQKVTDGTKRFIVISIEEFEEKPVICKKDYSVEDEKGKKFSLRKGDICTRAIGTKPQSTKVTSHTDLRDIFDLAITKGVRKFLRQEREVGLSPNTLAGITDEGKFDEQLKDFL